MFDNRNYDEFWQQQAEKERSFEQFKMYESEREISGEGLNFVVDQYGFIKNMNKLLVPNLTVVQRRFIEKYLGLMREYPYDVITVQEIDRFFLHAYRLGANDIIFKTGSKIKIKLSGYLFSISQRKMSEEDMIVFTNAVYDNDNGYVLLQGANDLDVGYSLRLDQMKSTDKVSDEESAEIVRYRVNITPCLVNGIRGFESTNRVFKSNPPTFDEIKAENSIRKAIYQRDGIIWIGGATGMGKSSLISACIHQFILEQNPRYGKFALFESPIEQVYDGLIKKYDSETIVTQTEIPFHLSNFEQSARNALRRALDVAVVGESRDYETVSKALEFAQQGGLLFTTIHVNNSISELIYRVVNMFPESQRETKLFEILTFTRLCVIQRLEPCLKGGRVAVREILEFTPAIISMLTRINNIKDVTNVLYGIVKEYGTSMSQSAQRLYDEGLIAESTLNYYLGLDQRIEAENAQILH